MLGSDPDVIKGAVAGAVASVFLLPHITGRAALSYFVVGSLTGTYLGPAVLGWLGLPDGPYALSAAGFLVGVSGMEICRRVPAWVASKLAIKQPPNDPPAGGSS